MKKPRLRMDHEWAVVVRMFAGVVALSIATATFVVWAWAK